ncbi:MAG: hypothetical protein K0U84_20055 [Actinomycetia bacterium]|nr:hypothetical protein [Actinomycetes bacterium]
MSYWDFGCAVGVYDRRDRRSLLVFLPDDALGALRGGGSLDDAPGVVALDYGHRVSPRFQQLSAPTTFGAAQKKIGDLMNGCRGPNVRNRRSYAADAEVIAAKLAPPKADRPRPRWRWWTRA